MEQSLKISSINNISGSFYTFMLLFVMQLMLLFSSSLKAQICILRQPDPIRSTVVDVSGMPLAGVKISTLPGFDTTTSDGKGNFILNISRFTKKLVFEKVGYLSLEITPDQFDKSTPFVMELSPVQDSMHILPYYEPLTTTAHSDQLLKGANGYRKLNRAPAMRYGLAMAPSGIVRRPAPVFYSNSESYQHLEENGFKSSISSPLSTFSIDVDKASYSNLRRFILNGNLPPKDAVRVEELINNFDYHYQQPKGMDPVVILPELSQAPWNKAHYLLRVGLQAREVATDKLPASNLVFLLDVSGSMAAANKLPLLVSSFKMLTDKLREQDYVSIVTYAGTAQSVLNPTSGKNKTAIKRALDGLRASGSTNGAGGLEKAYALAEKHFKKGGNNRIILASDGDFNVGASSLEALEDLITAKRKSGIFLSVLGFGMGNYQDDNMELLADKGNGNYAYIDNSQEARKVFLKEFGGTLFTVAKDVKVQVEFNPDKVEAYRLIGYENRALADEDFNRDSVDAGEMGSGSTVTALYEIIPRGVKDEFSPNIDSLRYVFHRLTGKASKGAELAQIKIRYKSPEGSESKLISRVVPNKVKDLSSASSDFKLAAAAAGWGMLLKNSEYSQKMSFEIAVNLVKKSLPLDEEGQIGEFLNLIKTSQALEGNEVKNAQPLIERPIHVRPIIKRPIMR